MDFKKLAERENYDAIVETAAKAAYAANVKYCKTIGDVKPVPFEECKTSMINGVLFIIGNQDAGDSAQHENWLKQKVSEGWVYGKVKDAKKKTHPCLVPFDQLPKEQQHKDTLFRETVLVALANAMRQPAKVAKEKAPKAVMATVTPGPVDATGAPVAGAAQSRLDAPSANSGPTDAIVASRAPKMVLVKKYGDAVPVAVKDQAHYDRLIAQHGRASVQEVA